MAMASRIASARPSLLKSWKNVEDPRMPFNMYYRTKAGFEGRQASAWLGRFAAPARQLRASLGLGERPKTLRQRLRQAQLSL
jgi:hypothetical protein